MAAALEAAVAKLGEERKAEPEPEAAPKSGTALLVPSNELLVPVALPEAIKEMNDKHAVISNLGGKCVVMEWTRKA